MKKILLAIFLAATVLLIYVFFIADDQESNHLAGPCDNPITYKIGNINAIYDMSELQLKEILKEAGDAWSSAAGKDLFTYSEKGDVSVNLIYGDQQRFMNKEEATVSRIRLEKMSYKTDEKRLLQLTTRYEEKKTAYEKLIAQYNRYVSDPSRSSTKESRVKQQKINQKRDEINRLGNTINSKVSALNRISERIDDMVADYNEHFGSQRKFNQGNYQKDPQGEAINIYSYIDVEELKLVLAHEMGHALGISHVQNSASIMFYLMKDQEKSTLNFTNEDLAALENICEN